MPEGPEIRIAADRIERALAGRTARSVRFAFPHLQPFESALERKWCGSRPAAMREASREASTASMSSGDPESRAGSTARSSSVPRSEDAAATGARNASPHPMRDASGRQHDDSPDAARGIPLRIAIDLVESTAGNRPTPGGRRGSLSASSCCGCAAAAFYASLSSPVVWCRL